LKPKAILTLGKYYNITIWNSDEFLTYFILDWASQALWSP
jgi:hypothetical protein